MQATIETVFISVLVAIVLAMGVVIYAEPFGPGVNAHLLGTKPPAEYALALATLLTAGIAALIAGRSLRLNAELGLAARFQKGLELLSADSQVSTVGGLLIIRDVARVSPGIYMRPMVDAVSAFVREQSDAYREEFYKAHSNRAHVSLQQEDFSYGRALAVLFNLRRSHLRKYGQMPGGRINLGRVWCPDFSFLNKSCNDVEATFLHRGMSFDGTSFENCAFTAAGLQPMTFTKCQFRDVEFDLSDKNAADGWQGVIFDENCKFINCTINGEPLTVPGKYHVSETRTPESITVDE